MRNFLLNLFAVIVFLSPLVIGVLGTIFIHWSFIFVPIFFEPAIFLLGALVISGQISDNEKNI